MSGLGRRTHYRKTLTDSVLNDFPEPQEDEKVAKVVATRGSNQFDILLPSTNTDHHSTPQLAILPTKFRKLVWVKRGDFVIVMTATNGKGEENDSGGIRFIISHILYKEQIKHLKTKDLWPTDPRFIDSLGATDDQESEEEGEKRNLDENDGIVYDDCYDEDNLFVNTNRMANLKIQDSSSESESEDE